jgi:hypothetical protein
MFYSSMNECYASKLLWCRCMHMVTMGKSFQRDAERTASLDRISLHRPIHHYHGEWPSLLTRSNQNYLQVEPYLQQPGSSARYLRLLMLLLSKIFTPSNEWMFIQLYWIRIHILYRFRSSYHHDDASSHIPILPLCDSLLLDTGHCRLCASIDQTWTNNGTHGPTGRGRS